MKKILLKIDSFGLFWIGCACLKIGAHLVLEKRLLRKRQLSSILATLWFWREHGGSETSSKFLDLVFCDFLLWKGKF